MSSLSSLVLLFWSLNAESLFSIFVAEALEVPDFEQLGSKAAFLVLRSSHLIRQIFDFSLSIQTHPCNTYIASLVL